ncbi:hypothetical protein Sango_1916900 [Sesamum angolense]|uniref:Uncharacterized protein n=1 Tax=Sesamum angolense TaxID=2727404 RepID=A0AAE1WDL8_9LAMI|nr:hypothetical protein Sango_1916900 [Sesamum angolense]
MNMKDKKDMEEIMNEHINLGLIEHGVSTYSSLGFLVRSHGEIKRGILIGEIGIELQNHIDKKIQNFLDGLNDKKHLQSFLESFNFAGIFIKDLARHRKDFQSLLKEIEGSKWKWEEIHTQRVCELKQVCSYLPKLAILEDEDELNAIRSSFLASTLLWNDLKESIRKASPLGKIHELREHDPRYALRVQDSGPVSSDLSTDCTRPSPDSDQTSKSKGLGCALDDGYETNLCGLVWNVPSRGPRDRASSVLYRLALSTAAMFRCTRLVLGLEEPWLSHAHDGCSLDLANNVRVERYRCYKPYLVQSECVVRTVCSKKESIPCQYRDNRIYHTL